MYARATALVAVLATSAACASSGPASTEPAPRDPVTRVTVSSGAGTIGATEIRNDADAATRTFPLPTDSLWAALPRGYEVLEIEGVGIAPDMRTYGVRNARPRRIEGKRLSTFIDCGMGPSGPRADEYRVTLTVLSTVRDAGDGSSILETLVEGSARPRSVAGNPITCQSNGMLETRIAELVVWALASGR